MNPFIDDSRLQYQERLHQAEQWRLAKVARANRLSRMQRWRVRIGDCLIALGQYLKAARWPAAQYD